MKGLFFLLLLSMASPVLSQQKHILVMGGGGEPKRSGTIFDEKLRRVGSFAKYNPEYQSKVIFNGGHSGTENIVKEKFNSYDNSNQFTKESFEAAITNYEKDIETGKIKANDQLLIYISSHGGDKKNETHEISTAEGTITNLDTLGSAAVSLDRLKKLTTLAEKKGIKLAIVDLSCHSGNTLALANSKTCVISGTGPNHYGFGGGFDGVFGNKFTGAFKKGKNLEEVFLETRKNYQDRSFPMISSPQGIEIQNKMYDPLTPYLYYYDTSGNKFSPFMEEEILKGDQCKIDEQFRELIQWSEILAKSSNNEIDKQLITRFEDTVYNYYKYIKELRVRMRTSGFPMMKKKNNFCTDIKEDLSRGIKASQECLNYFTVENLMSLDFKAITDFYKKQLSQGTEEERARVKAVLENYKKAEDWKNYILKEHPEYSEISKFWENLHQLEPKTHLLAMEVSEAQQKFYDLLYKKSKAKGPNPCKDFVL
jgi:hypothetical protein